MTPCLDEYLAAAASQPVVPCWCELPADLETPLSVFLKLRKEGPAYLLESVERGEVVGRYSILGTSPTFLLRCHEGQVETADGVQPRGDRDALEWLRTLMAPMREVKAQGLPSFWGGAVGYLSYDAIRQWQPLGGGPVDDLGLPEAQFLLSREGVVFDHARQRMFLYVATYPERGAQDEYRLAQERLAEMRRRLALPLQPPAAPPKMAGQESFNRTREDFEAAVVRAQEAIAQGEVFQMVLSQRLHRTTSCDAVSLYRALRLCNPSPYMVLLDFGDYQLIGASPEMLVRLEGQRCTTRPIAGTRPRGADEKADEALEVELLDDPKERAEHVMLVDLGRNDLGRVSRYGTVEVPQFMQVERFSHVMHIVSRVESELSEGKDGYDLIRSAFPAGTVSGAPKLRAMQLLDEMEPTRRGVYAGAVGVFSFSGDVNTCITIRTMLKRGNDLYLQAGAGIVADSDPAKEYDETLAKLAGLRSAVEMAEGGWLHGGYQ
ncbi:MAG: anthranilate synthase component I [Candidatus Eremiobacteraeota bacterium]|nr:anthranilate synthase component I [Candidatus Eremiobacteraeota bacterium]